MSLKIGLYDLYAHVIAGGTKCTMVQADHWSRHHKVTLLVSQPVDVSAAEQYFGVDLSRVEILPLGAVLPAESRESLRLKELLADFQHFRKIRALKLDVFVSHTYHSAISCPAPRGIFQCMFPHILSRTILPASRQQHRIRRALWRIGWRIMGRDPDTPHSYSAIAANSQFTRDWVQKRWGLPATVVYPVCDTVTGSGEKEKIILNVGRFFPDKKQNVLLEAFCKATALHEAGWQLHFAGSMLHSAPTYVARLKELACGFPVMFHTDLTMDQLHDLYQRTSIYWHAKGYGANPETRPQDLEHFGIATGEAMSAGAVPVVINAGGQPEIVTHERDGFLWNTLDQMIADTRRLAEDEALRRRMSKAALAAGARFNRAAFAARLDTLLEQVMNHATVPL